MNHTRKQVNCTAGMDDVHVVGFDGSNDVLNSIKAGEITIAMQGITEKAVRRPVTFRYEKSIDNSVFFIA